MDKRWLFLGLGGILGTVCRFLVYEAVVLARQQQIARVWWPNWLPADFPWATWMVNLSGSFGFGLLFVLFSAKQELDPVLKAGLFVGFFGAYTTFSTLAWETASLLERECWGLAIANLIGQNAFGLLAALAGMALARALA